MFGSFFLFFCPVTLGFIFPSTGCCAFHGAPAPMLPVPCCFWALLSHRGREQDDCNTSTTRPRGSFITVQYPSSQKLLNIFGTGNPLIGNQYNHGNAGMTFPFDITARANIESTSVRSRLDWPRLLRYPDSSWRRICLRSTIGYGISCYDATRNAALAWEFHDGRSKGIIALNEGPSPRTPSLRFLATYSKLRLPFRNAIFVVNPVSVVYDVVDKQKGDFLYTSTAYGTLKGHWLCGEERVCVRFDNVTEAVEVEILSYSKPARSFMGYLVWPFVGKLQREFFDQEMVKLKQIGTSPNLATSPAE